MNCCNRADSPLKNGADAAQGCGAEFRRLCKSRENRKVGRSAFGQPAVEKARDGFFNGLISRVSVSGKPFYADGSGPESGAVATGLSKPSTISLGKLAR